MKYAEFRERSHFSREEVLALAYGRLVKDAPDEFKARFPLPPMLMVDRVTEITRKGARGRIVAEREVRVDDWFFHCHFLGDPVQPGCLGVDAIWQLIGMYCAWNGALGTGRALGCQEVEFFGQIRPHDGLVRYEIDIVRYQELATSGSSVALESSVYEVLLRSGHVLRVPPGFDREALRALVSVLEERPC